ncbi:MAG: VCBS repeat-containing protein [Flavobacteriales bacterium]|nr:VCBS repeat-containing protein [Flavobacteriales bacterium]
MFKPVLTLVCSAMFASAFGQGQCSGALPITAGTHVVDTVVGTPPSLLCSQWQPAPAAVWYAYTPASDLGLTVSSDLLANIGGDTRLSVFRGTCDQLVCVTADDDGGDLGNGFLSLANFNVSQGVTYYLVWDSRWNSSGFTFSVEEGPLHMEPLSFTSTAPEPPLATGIGTFVLAVVDMNNDLLDDIVTVQGTNVLIHMQQPEGGFELRTFPTGPVANAPSWSLCAGDLNGDGHNDLVYGGQQGVSMMMSNSSGTAFTAVSYPQYVFSQRSNMVDIDNDGLLDAFVCHDVDPNVFFTNNGDGTLAFHQGGLGDHPDGGNYGSIWIDYDNDRDMDLYIAKCKGSESTARRDELHRNNGDGTFTEVIDQVGLGTGMHQSWSSAWGDFDRDGDLDVVIGASTTINGGHKVFRNDNGRFTEVTAGSGLDIFMGTSNEWTTHDFNNDGHLDILGGGALHLGRGDFTFARALNTNNHAVGDLNDDGFLDLLGDNAIRYNNGNGNNWLKVHTTGTVSNHNGIGARVIVTTASGSQMREIRSGDGFRYMSSLTAHFGLGTDELVDEVRVLWPSGLTTVITDVDINKTVEIIENTTTDVADVTEEAPFRLFPNPVTNELTLDLPAQEVISIIITDATGRVVLQDKPTTLWIDVSRLSAGMYTIQAIGRERSHSARFTKH